jgi:hypothetical protein
LVPPGPIPLVNVKMVTRRSSGDLRLGAGRAVAAARRRGLGGAAARRGEQRGNEGNRRREGAGEELGLQEGDASAL